MAAPGENENSQDERFDLSQFLETWIEILPESYFLTNINQELERRIMKTEMAVSDEMLMELESVCSVETLTQVEDDTDDAVTEEEKKNDPLMAECMMLHVIPESSANKLITLRNHKQYLLAQEAFPRLKQTFLPMMIEFNAQKIRRPHPSEAAPSTSTDDMLYDCVDADLIITIQVFQPMLYHRGKSSAFVDCEYIVRGTTLLSEFRDVIHCVRDSVISADMSNDPDPSKYAKAKDVYKSGFLYIDQVFYNDMRDANSIDYSKNILEWGQRESVAELLNAKAVELGDLKFMDLKLKLNEVYLYQHQGDCEHVFAFTDIRLVHEDDPPNKPGLYPLLTKSKHKKRQLCRMCWKLQAKWLMNEDRYAIDDPTYMCDTCLKYLHYDSEGRKTETSGDFKAFYFLDRTHTDACVMGDHSNG